MKKAFLFLTFLFSMQLIAAQDLIVTTQGDSIECKITKIKPDYIYFIFKHKNEIRNTLLAKWAVKDYHYNYYPHSELDSINLSKVKDYPSFRLAFNVGRGYQTARVSEAVPEDFQNYVKEMKWGMVLAADLTYYISEPIGFGLKYNYFHTSNQIDNIYIQMQDGSRLEGDMSDDIHISFIGPMLSTRYLNQNKKNAGVLNFAVGYLGLKNNNKMINDYKITGSTVGLLCDFGYDIGLSKNLALGFQLTFLTGNLFQYKISDGVTTERIKLSKDNYESLSRIDLTVGLRLYK